MSRIFTKSGEEAVRNRDLAVRVKMTELAQRGAIGGPALFVAEEAAVACVREFAREAAVRLLETMRDAYDDVPAEALDWIRETIQARVRSFAESLGSSLAEGRRRAGVPTDGAGRRVLQAANRALVDLDVLLAPIQLRHEQQEELSLSRDVFSDRVKVTKQDGRVFNDVAVSVQRDKVYFPDTSVPIQDGDVVERALPGEVVERYIVADAGFRRGGHGIPDHYQSVVKKDGGLRGNARDFGATTIYNITGPQARINVNSTDASTNILNVDSPTLFASMRNAVSGAGLSDEVCAELMGRIEAMQAESTRPSFAKRYAEFMGFAADHLQIFGPFLPALAQLLVRTVGG